MLMDNRASIGKISYVFLNMNSRRKFRSLTSDMFADEPLVKLLSQLAEVFPRKSSVEAPISRQPSTTLANERQLRSPMSAFKALHVFSYH